MHRLAINFSIQPLNRLNNQKFQAILKILRRYLDFINFLRLLQFYFNN